MAGLRIGYGVGHPSIIHNLRKVQCTFPVDCVSVAFAEEILDNIEVEDKLYKEFQRGKEYITKCLEEEGIEYHMGESNFVLIKCNKKIINKLKELRVLVKGNFNQGILKDYVRVTIGSKDQMEVFWCNFLKVVKYCD